MSKTMTKAVALHLKLEDYERLEAVAREQSMEPGDLALDFVRDCLEGTEIQEERHKRMMEALARFEALRKELREAGYPSIDAVEVARQSREELEQRSIF